MIEDRFNIYRDRHIQNLTKILELSIQKVADQSLSTIISRDINPYALFNILNGAVSKPYYIKERSMTDGLVAGYIIKDEHTRACSSTAVYPSSSSQIEGEGGLEFLHSHTTSDSYKPLIINFEKNKYYIKKSKYKEELVHLGCLNPTSTEYSGLIHTLSDSPCEDNDPVITSPNPYDKKDKYTIKESLSNKCYNIIEPVDLEPLDKDNIVKVMVDENDRYICSDIDIIMIINENNTQPYYHDHMMGYINEYEKKIITHINRYFNDKLTEYSTEKRSQYSNIVTHGSYIGLLSKDNIKQKELQNSAVDGDSMNLDTWRNIRYPKPPIRVHKPYESSFTLDTAEEVAYHIAPIVDRICH